MPRIILFLAALLPFATYAVDTFTLQSPDVKPNASIRDAQIYKGPGYGGPCPPKGDKPHRYIFTVHALKADKLDLDDKAMPALVGFMLNSNRIDKATFIATYGRK